MKLYKGLLASLLAVSLTAGSLVSAAESHQPTVAERLEKAAVYMKEAYAPAFADGELSANMWTMLCAVGADKLDDPDYAFLIPDVDAAGLNAESSLSDYACTIITLEMLKENPADQDGRDLVKELADKQGKDGVFTGPSGNATANELPYVILALETTKADYDRQGALDSLVELRKEDGGYSWDSTAQVGNVDTSGMVLFGLAAADSRETAQPTVDYLLGALNEDGYFVGTDSYATANACSQAMALLGLLAVEVPTEQYANAQKALYALQAENGGFLYDLNADAPDYFSTYQGLLALAAIRLAEPQTPPDTSESISSDTVETVTSDSGMSDSSDVNGSMTQGKQDTDNHKTGDEGINPIIIVVLVIAVAAVVACVVVPMVTKKKKRPDDPHDDQNHLNS